MVLDGFLKEYTDVFTGMGELAGEYTIHIDPNVSPVVHPIHSTPKRLQRMLL